MAATPLAGKTGENVSKLNGPNFVTVRTCAKQASGFLQVSPRSSHPPALSRSGLSPAAGAECWAFAVVPGGPAGSQRSLSAVRATGMAVPSSAYRLAGVAQLVEHLFCKQVVRGSSPLASSIDLEGCPSGQREQAVNLPAFAYVGSNPTPSTVVHRGLGSRPRALGRRPRSLSLNAGVAQLVERQPSKLNVVGSSPISRSAPRPHSTEALPT